MLNKECVHGLITPIFKGVMREVYDNKICFLGVLNSQGLMGIEAGELE